MSEKKELWTFDVTLHELKNPQEHWATEPVFEFLKQHWIEPHPERERDMQVGTVYVFVDEEGHLHMDFCSRFTLDPVLQDKLSESKRQVIQLTKPKGRNV